MPSGTAFVVTVIDGIMPPETDVGPSSRPLFCSLVSTTASVVSTTIAE